MTRWRSMVAMSLLLVTAAVVVLLMRRHRSADVTKEYADSNACALCHAAEATGYARTGMAHAFSVPDANDGVDGAARDEPFHHATSDTWFSLTRHDGRYFQKRWQKGFDGNPDNVEELAIDFVMGSGNHVRTYLHREQDGTLVELPLAWYSEDGGHWGMNPGFDNAHPMTRRPIAYECMFCHNAYPEIPPAAHRDLSAIPVYGATLPTGIDCQRCHGPGAAHIKAAKAAGTSLQEINSLILNPAHLSNDRQMEVCEQCHLETTSRQLPDRIRHYDREPFGYQAGQPLAEFNSYFARDPEKGRTDNFEIVSAPYRLRQSQCYLKSQGALTCESCHNPHDLHKGSESASYYAGICMRCHAATLPAKIASHQHPIGNDCVSCHMPKRRTEDVVHAVMTDHLIQRRPPPAEVLLAMRKEIPDTGADAYRGPVKPYRLDHQASGSDDALYEAAAQVIDSSNLQAGIPVLKSLIEARRPSQPNFSIELGDALRHTGDLSGAIEAYRQALSLDPLSSRAQRRLGVALGSAGETNEAVEVLGNAIEREPANALLWYERGLIESKSGAQDKAANDLHKALELRPDFADARNTLGLLLVRSGDIRSAEAAFRAALLVNPYDSGTRANLGRLLAGQGDWKQAAFQLEKAVRLDSTNFDAHADYAIALLQMNHMPEAEAEARAATGAAHPSARAHDLLGEILVQRGHLDQGRSEFEAALKLDPGFGPALLDLAQILLRQNHAAAARALIERAESSPVPDVAKRARAMLQGSGPR